MLLEIIFMPDTALKPQMLFRLTKRKSLELKKTSLLDSRLVNWSNGNGHFNERQ